MLAFAASVLLTNFTVRPGPGNHLSMALTITLGLGTLGALITLVVAKFVAAFVERRAGK